MNSGFIKLHRKITEWEWYSDVNARLVFMHLLIKANYKASRFQGREIPIGSLVIGRKALATEIGLSEQQVRTSINKLKSTNEITIKATNKFSICTIVKWAEYQCKESTKKQTNNQQITNNQPTSNQQVTTSKEVKKLRSKEVKNKQGANAGAFDASRFEVFWNLFPNKRGKQKALEAFKRLNPDDLLFKKMMDGLKSEIAFRESMADSTEFVQGWKYGQGWINGRRWEDELTPAKASAPVNYLEGVRNA